jgi:signal transduction histidine kinase
VPDGAKATAAFRIFQEMLSNVARHAQATQVRIVVRLTPAELAMEVEDNGVGAMRDALEASTSYGVMGMRERALHFGGALSIAGARSAPDDGGPGTLVCLRLPLSSRN